MSERLTLSLYLFVIELKLVDQIQGNLCTMCILHWSGFTRETDLIGWEHINTDIYDKRLAQVMRWLRSANPLPFGSRPDKQAPPTCLGLILGSCDLWLTPSWCLGRHPVASVLRLGLLS